MNVLNKIRKGQGLPLNTIVIAILVIIVMLVIIVFFTSKVGQSGDTIDDTTDSLRACEVGSFLIPNDKYESADPVKSGECNTAGKNVIPGVKVPEDHVCCATQIKK